jgi:MFS family permease
MTCLQLSDAFTKLLVGAAADRAIASGRLSVLDVRKFLSCSGFMGFGAALLACSMLSDWRLITAALVIGKGFSSLHAPGFKTNYLDLTTRDVGSLMGVGNSAATLSSTVAPVLAGFVVEEYGWSAMFQMSAVVTVSGAVVFGAFASASNLDAHHKRE